MEPVEAPVRYIIRTTVKRVENVERQIRAFKQDNNTITERENMGWFIQFEGSWEALSLGMDKPRLAVGDRVQITIERIENAQPC